MNYKCLNCQDTHRVWSSARKQFGMCVICPTPCPSCVHSNLVPYCKEPHCKCLCHPDNFIKNPSNIERRIQALGLLDWQKKTVLNIIKDYTVPKEFKINELKEAEDQIAKLEKSLVSILAWTYGGACPDCDMFRSAPCRIDFRHHKDCGFLKEINKALIILGREPEEGHDYDNPKEEMIRLANERAKNVKP